MTEEKPDRTGWILMNLLWDIGMAFGFMVFGWIGWALSDVVSGPAAVTHGDRLIKIAAFGGGMISTVLVLFITYLFFAVWFRKNE